MNNHNLITPNEANCISVSWKTCHRKHSNWITIGIIRPWAHRFNANLNGNKTFRPWIAPSHYPIDMFNETVPPFWFFPVHFIASKERWMGKEANLQNPFKQPTHSLSICGAAWGGVAIQRIGFAFGIDSGMPMHVAANFEWDISLLFVCVRRMGFIQENFYPIFVIGRLVAISCAGMQKSC